MKSTPSTQLLSDVELLLESLEPLAEPSEKPVFLALTGLPGTGKSYFSRKLSDKLPVVILESDALRKVLVSTPKYTWWESNRLFRALYFLIEKLLVQGISVIMDATNLSERYREKLYNIAVRTKVKFILVKIEAPEALVKKRLETRRVNPLNRSDADWEIYQAMRPRAERIRHKHYVVDTSKDIQPIIKRIIRQVKKGD